MSMRTDYELNVVSDVPLQKDQLQGFLEAIGHADVPIFNSDEEDQEDEYLRIDRDDKGFYLLLRQVRPENFDEHLAQLSREAEATFDVDEYLREPTETTESGRNRYLIVRGEMKLMPSGLDLQERATVLAALRFWKLQSGDVDNRAEMMPSHFADYRPLTDAEIDDLCGRIERKG